MNSCKAIVLISGGIDSYACANFLIEQGFDVRGVFVDYGQAALEFESKAVQHVASLLNLPISIYKVSGASPFPAGEVIGRNAFLILTALLLSKITDGLIALGIHAGTPYYDCSPEFVISMDRLLAGQTNGAVKVTAPFIHWSKADIFDYFNVSHLSLAPTYSCEDGVDGGCGHCASCKDRKALDAC